MLVYLKGRDLSFDGFDDARTTNTSLTSRTTSGTNIDLSLCQTNSTGHTLRPRRLNSAHKQWATDRVGRRDMIVANNLPSTPVAPISAWTLHDPAIRQLSLDTIKKKNRQRSLAPLSKSSNKMEVAIRDSQSTSLFRSVGRVHRELLDCTYQQFLKSAESGQAFSQQPKPFIRQKQPEELPKLPMASMAPTGDEHYLSRLARRKLSENMALASSEFDLTISNDLPTTDDDQLLILSRILQPYVEYVDTGEAVSSEHIKPISQRLLDSAEMLEINTDDLKVVLKLILELALDRESFLTKSAKRLGFKFKLDILEAVVTELSMYDPLSSFSTFSESAFGSSSAGSSTVTVPHHRHHRFSWLTGNSSLTDITPEPIRLDSDMHDYDDEIVFSSERLAINPVVRQHLMMGLFDQVPVVQSKVVRIYISSNYSDMKDVRNYLLIEAVPALQEFCEQSGLQFQLVDLNWGISEDIMFDQDVKICLRQIQLCRQYSSGPFYIALLGDRYGNQLLPTFIPAEHMDIITSCLESTLIPNRGLLKEWYKLDVNSVPSAYVIEPAEKKIEFYRLNDELEHRDMLMKRAARQWLLTAKQLCELIDKGCRLAVDKGFMMTEVADGYFCSLLEKELMSVISDVTLESPYCMSYCRNISSINAHLADELASKFVDIVQHKGLRSLDKTKYLRIQSLKSLVHPWTRRHDRIYDGSMWEIGSVSLNGSDIILTDKTKTIDYSQVVVEHEGRIFDDPSYIQQFNVLDEAKVPGTTQTAWNAAFLTALTDTVLDKMMADFIHDCKEMIVAYHTDKFRIPRYVNFNEEEIINCANILKNHHDKNALLSSVLRQSLVYSISGAANATGIAEDMLIAKSLTDNAFGYWRISELKTSFLSCARRRCPLVIHGPAGSGRTSMVAIVTKYCRYWLFAPQTVVVTRVIGSSPASLTVGNLLSTICYQILQAFGCTDRSETDLHCGRSRYLESAIAQIEPFLSETRQLVIILDGLEVLQPTCQAHSLLWLPYNIPENVCFVLTTDSSDGVIMHGLNNYMRLVALCVGLDEGVTQDCFLEVTQLDSTEQRTMIDRLLHRSRRQLTTEQYEVVLDAINANPWPLYVSLLMTEVVIWPSTVDVSEISLAANVDVAVSKLLLDLETRLGSVFVTHAVSYVTIDAHGLTELELEDVLACDDEVLEEVFQSLDPPLDTIIRVPQLLIARLLYSLRYLTELVFNHGLPVIRWKHQQFVKAVSSRYLQRYDENGRVQFTNLFYGCNQQLANLFSSCAEVTRTVRVRNGARVIENAQRRIAPRLLSNRNWRMLFKLPVFVYNSAPEAEILPEYKAKILCNTEWLITKLKGRPFSETLDNFNLVRHKDDDILLVENILCTAPSIREHPKQLLLELLARFSRSSHLQSPVISQMVNDAWVLALQTKQPLLLPLYPCVSASRTLHKSDRNGPTHVLKVLSVSGSAARVLIWGERYGFAVWVHDEESNCLEPEHLYRDLVPLSSFVIGADATLVFMVFGAMMLTKWFIETGNIDYSLDLSTPLRSAGNTISRDGGPGDQTAVPMALSSDNSLLVIRIINIPKPTDVVGYIFSGLVVMDINAGVIIGNVGRTLYGAGHINVEFVRDTSMLLVTYTSRREDMSGSITGEQDFLSARTNTIYVFNQVPASYYSAVVSLPSTRNWDIPVVFHDKYAYIACRRPTSICGDILRLELTSGKFELSSVSPPLDPDRDGPPEHLVNFAINPTGQLVAVYNTSYCTIVKIMMLSDNAEGTWLALIESEFESASCMLLAAKGSILYIGYRHCGVIEKYSLEARYRVGSMTAHYGDVNTITEVKPGIICSSGSDCSLKVFNMANDIMPVNSLDFTQKLKPRSAIPVEELLYYRISEGIMSLQQLKKSRHLLICHSIHLSVLLLNIRDDLVCHRYGASSADFDLLTHAWSVCDDSLILGYGILNNAAKFPATGKLQIWDARTRHLKFVDLHLYADLCCVTRDGHHVGMLRKSVSGCRAVVFKPGVRPNYRSKFFSQRPSSASRILLTDDLQFMIAIESHQLILWRMAETTNSSQTDYLSNDLNDYDDGYFSDTYIGDFNYPPEPSADDSITNTFFVTPSKMQLRETKPNPSSSRYLLKVVTGPECVMLTTGSCLIVGTHNGFILEFNLNVIIPGNVRKKEAMPRFCRTLNGIEHKGSVTTICVSPVTERYIVSGSVDHMLLVFDREQDDYQSKLLGHADKVLCACITVNDMHILSGSADCTIRLWQLSTGIMLSVFDACVDIYNITVYLQDDHDSQLRIAALADKKHSRKLMLFRTANVVTTYQSDNF